MADKTINQLTQATALTDSSLFVIEQNSTAKQANWGMIKNYISLGVAAHWTANEALKVNKPLSNGTPTNGTSGQVLRTNGDGTTAWDDVAMPTDEQTASALAAWLAQHPEAVTTVQDGSISENKLASDLKAQGRNAQLYRHGRLLNRYGYETNGEDYLRGQGVAFYDGKYYVCGELSGGYQTVSVFGSNGEPITHKTDYTELGHANNVAATEDYLLIGDGSAPKVHVLNRSTLAFVKTINLNGYFRVIDAVATQGGDAYAYGYTPDNKLCICSVNYAESSYDIICKINDVRNSVGQGCCVLGNHMYILHNRSNMVYRVDLTQKFIDKAYYIPDGDGFFPCGECEDMFVKDGKVFISAALYYPQKDDGINVGYMMAVQLFETDIADNPFMQKRQYTSYMYPQSEFTLVVNPAADYAFNPQDNFTTIEEACHILNYHKAGRITLKNIDNAGHAQLLNGVYNVVGTDGTRILGVLECINSVVNVHKVNTVLHFVARMSNCTVRKCDLAKIKGFSSNVHFVDISLADCTSIVQNASSFEYDGISAVNANLSITSGDMYGNTARVTSTYNSKLAWLMRACYGRVLLEVLGSEAVTTTCSRSYVGAGASWENDIKSITYNKFQYIDGEIKLKKIADSTYDTLSGSNYVRFSSITA